jgi:hypothetical protein
MPRSSWTQSPTSTLLCSRHVGHLRLGRTFRGSEHLADILSRARRSPKQDSRNGVQNQRADDHELPRPRSDDQRGAERRPATSPRYVVTGAPDSRKGARSRRVQGERRLLGPRLHGNARERASSKRVTPHRVSRQLRVGLCDILACLGAFGHRSVVRRRRDRFGTPRSDVLGVR